MASPDHPDAKRLSEDAPPPILRLTADLLADILLRLPALADVGRAASACPVFRSVVADGSFLRRLRSTHRPLFLGFLSSTFHPAEPPHTSAPCAAALVRAADFSFSFVPSAAGGGGTTWLLLDYHGGRALIESSARAGDLAVADPVSRRYVLLPRVPGLPIPDNLRRCSVHLERFFAPTNDGDGDGDGDNSFRVICMAWCDGHLVAFVFSSANTVGWSAIPFQDRSPFATRHKLCHAVQPLWRYCACGCFFWKTGWASNKLLVLDTRRMHFSTKEITLINQDPDCSAIIQAGDGWVETSTVWNGALYSVRERDLKVLLNQSQMPFGYTFTIAGSADRHLLLRGNPVGSAWPDKNVAAYFSLDLETNKVENVCRLMDGFRQLSLCFGFPPSLSIPSL